MVNCPWSRKCFEKSATCYIRQGGYVLPAFFVSLLVREQDNSKTIEDSNVIFRECWSCHKEEVISSGVWI